MEINDDRDLTHESLPCQAECTEHPDPAASRDEVSRREFVATIGVVAGGISLRFPALNADGMLMAEPAQEASSSTVALEFSINGRKHGFSLDPRVTLLDLLREDLGLTGTKKGCDHGQCGACTVLVNGRRINSCLSLAVSHQGDEITTIEGIAKGDSLDPMQTAFLEHDGFQCGYCTPGQICSAVALMKEARAGDASYVTTDLAKSGPAELTPEEIRERMSGNICRCGAYPGIVQAVGETYRHEAKS
jgi:xanthine dehydrogenase YagT iron-sulfur-binding subunit